MEKASTEIKEFALESYGILDQLERALMTPRNEGFMTKRFSDSYSTLRAFRKAGGSRGLKNLEGLAQTGEVILSLLDKGSIYPQPRVLSFLLNLIGDLRKEITFLKDSGLQPRFNVTAAPPEASPAVQNLPRNPLPWLQKTLIFRTPDDGRMAIPFDHVMRLESFDESKLEEETQPENGNRWMPLVDVSKILPERRLIFRRPPVPRAKGQTRQKIVYVTPEGEVGLVVDAVLDVLKAKLEVQRPAVRAGVLGSMQLKDRITELPNVPSILAQSGLRFITAESTPFQNEKIAS